MTNTINISGATLSNQISQFTPFYKRLGVLGFKKKYIKDVLLPDWWCDEFEQEPGSLVEAAAYISQRTKLDFSSLLNKECELSFPNGGDPCYKLRQGTEMSSLINARMIGERVAEMISFACRRPFRSIANLSAQIIRSQILATNKFVTLESLLDFCWQNGIAVVHVSNFPKDKGLKKFDGMVGQYNDRPVILISKNHKSHALLAFVLAHELGHIVRGHIKKGSSIVDEKVKPNEEGDIQEVEADEFAVELIYGRRDASYWCSRNLDPKALEVYAREHSKSDVVNAAAIVLNYAWFKEKMANTNEEEKVIWAIAGTALKEFEYQYERASGTINGYLQQEIEWDDLSDDNQEFLERMANIE